MKYLRKIPGWPFLPKQEFYKIVLSFIFLGLVTGAVGAWLNYIFQQDSWKRNIQYELLKGDLDTNRELISNISNLIDQRLYATKQYIWLYGHEQSPYEAWEEYVQAVDSWDASAPSYKLQLALLADESVVKELENINNRFTQIGENFTILQQLSGNCMLIPQNCTYQPIQDQLDLLISLTAEIIIKKTQFLNTLNDKLIRQKIRNFKSTL